MRGYGSLFERLETAPSPARPLSVEDAMVTSVAAHLAKMLSTRVGSVQTLPDYGLPDLNDMRLSHHDALQRARVAIERFIERYEPRLCQVRVIPQRPAHEGLTLDFAINARLRAAGFGRAVSFTASLDGSGNVRVM